MKKLLLFVAIVSLGIVSCKKDMEPAVNESIIYKTAPEQKKLVDSLLTIKQQSNQITTAGTSKANQAEGVGFAGSPGGNLGNGYFEMPSKGYYRYFNPGNRPPQFLLMVITWTATNNSTVVQPVAAIRAVSQTALGLIDAPGAIAPYDIPFEVVIYGFSLYGITSWHSGYFTVSSGNTGRQQEPLVAWIG